MTEEMWPIGYVLRAYEIASKRGLWGDERQRFIEGQVRHWLRKAQEREEAKDDRATEEAGFADGG